MKFVTVLGFFAAIVFGGLNYGEAIDVKTARTKVAALFQQFGQIIGDDAKTYTQGLWSAFNSSMEKLTEAAQNIFNQYNHYFVNAEYYKNLELYGNKNEELSSALASYVNSFSGEAVYPLQKSVDDLKKSSSQKISANEAHKAENLANSLKTLQIL